MSSSSPEPENKRKRTAAATVSEDELEIDINLPEPPSKKAKRAEKKKEKSKSKTKAAKFSTSTDDHVAVSKNDNADLEDEKPAQAPTNATGRTDFGIWIGNLPFSATKDSLRDFFKNEGKIESKDVVRLHLPTPSDKRDKAANKGFAYVDFSTQEVLEKAMALTEYMLSGRRVLIKNAKSFEGRPAKVAVDAGAAANGAIGGVEGEKPKEPARRVFVGNLGFDVTKDDLTEHFGQAGEVEDIHMATFQDSGKCKGYAWIRFVEAESAIAAVRGFVYVKAESDDEGGTEDEAEGVEDGDGEGKVKRKKSKKSGTRRHKKHLNRLHGRDLRCEIAEDSQTRYKKRFGKKDDTNGEQNGTDRARPARSFDRPAYRTGIRDATTGSEGRQQRPDKDQRRDERRKRHDARTVAPGKALADAPRATGAIVEGKGNKIAFD